MRSWSIGWAAAVVALFPVTGVEAQSGEYPQTTLHLFAFGYDLSEYRGGSASGGGVELERVYGESWKWGGSVRLALGIPSGRDDSQPIDQHDGQLVFIDSEGLELIGPGLRVRGAYSVSKGAWRTEVGPEVGLQLGLTEGTGVRGKLRPLVGLRWDLGRNRIGLVGRGVLFRVPVQWTGADSTQGSFGDWRRMWEVGITLRL